MLAIEPSIDWIDCQARKDVMNFYQFDPIASHGIDVGAARRNPHDRAGPLPRHHPARALRKISLAVLPRAFPVRDGQRTAQRLRLLHDRLRTGPAQRARGRPRRRAGCRHRRFRRARSGLEKDRSGHDGGRKMPPISAKWNHPPAAAVEKSGIFRIPPPRNRIGSPGWLWRSLWCKACGSMGWGERPAG